MSHIAKVELKIKDLACLKTACQELGLEFMQGQTSHKYYQDKRNPCLHALRVKGNDQAYEIGVVQNKDGTYGLEWDSFGGGKGLVQVVGKNCAALKQSYAKAITLKQARSLGMRAITHKDQTGRMVITLEK